jgi:hypothetical protein
MPTVRATAGTCRPFQSTSAQAHAMMLLTGGPAARRTTEPRSTGGACGPTMIASLIRCSTARLRCRSGAACSIWSRSNRSGRLFGRGYIADDALSMALSPRRRHAASAKKRALFDRSAPLIRLLLAGTFLLAWMSASTDSAEINIGYLRRASEVDPVTDPNASQR